MARFQGTEKKVFIDNMREKGNFYQLLDAGMLKRTIPDKPNSPLQKYIKA